MILWLYKLYLYLYSFYISCIRESITYYTITPEGNQVPYTYSADYVLIVYKTKKYKKYRFIHNPSNVNYNTFETPSYHLMGMSVNVHNKSYVIRPDDFLITNNVLFTPTFNLWFCKYYLGVKPTDKITTTVIDDKINVHMLDGPLVIKSDSFI